LAKKATMQAIADELNISKSLVSKALSNKHGVKEETKKKVIQAANRLGYKINSSILKIGSSENGSIALILPREDLKDLEYWGKIIQGVEEELSKSLFSLILAGIDNNQPSSKGLPSCITDRKVDGAIIMGRVEATYVHAISLTGIPVILLDSDNSSKFDHILADNYDGGFDAVNFLFENNHRKIGFVGDTRYSFSFQERYRGYKGGIDNFLQKTNDQTIALFDITDERENDRIPVSIAQLEKMLHNKQNLPTALICANDPVAMKVLEIMKKYNLNCPKDISIIGFDNLSKDQWIKPQLTSIDASISTMGKRVVELMIRRMENPKGVHEKVMIITKIVKRESVISI